MSVQFRHKKFFCHKCRIVFSSEFALFNDKDWECLDPEGCPYCGEEGEERD